MAQGQAATQRFAASICDRRRRVRGRDGAERLGKIHLHEYPWLPGYAHLGDLPFKGIDVGAWPGTSARCCAGILSALSFRVSIF